MRVALNKLLLSTETAFNNMHVIGYVSIRLGYSRGWATNLQVQVVAGSIGLDAFNDAACIIMT